MAKVADKYLKVDPWAIIEEGFDPERNRTSESIFHWAMSIWVCVVMQMKVIAVIHCLAAILMV